MFELRLPVHSIIDVITNSSTEIFSFATSDSIVQVKKIVNAVLKAADSIKIADDLFEFDLVPNEDIIDSEFEYICEHTIPVLKWGTQSYNDLKQKIENDIMRDGVNYVFENKNVPAHDSYGCNNPWLAWDLRIRAKAGVVLDDNLVSLLKGVFEYQEVQC